MTANPLTHARVTLPRRFFRCLEHGSVPIVVGAPNIADFAPSAHSFLHIRSPADAPLVAARIQSLADNASAYEALLAYKQVSSSGVSSQVQSVVLQARGYAHCYACYDPAPLVAQRIRSLADNASAYEAFLAYKHVGLSVMIT
jgi:glycoprotein 3-alpha-L-fucosyltransferase